MTLDQVKKVREYCMKEVENPNGTKTTASKFMHLYIDGGINYITSDDCILFDDENELLHCIGLNTDGSSQADAPVSVFTCEYGVIQNIEAVYSLANLDGLMDNGYLSFASEEQKKFIKAYAKRFKNQALQPNKAYPYYSKDANVVPMGNNQFSMVRDDGIMYPSSSTSANKIIKAKYTKNVYGVDGATAYRTQKTRTGEECTQPKKLVPIVGSAQAGNDENNMPNKCENYVDWKLEVENTCDEDCWVRIFLAIPKFLDCNEDASLNLLHWNVYYVTTNPDCPTGDFYNWGWDCTPWPPDNGGNWNNFDATIDGIVYTVYPATYYRKLGAGETAEPSLKGYYLDKNVMVEDKEDGSSEYFVFKDTAGVGYASEANLPKTSGIKEGMYARVGDSSWYKFTNGAWAATEEIPEKVSLGDLNKIDLMKTAVQIMPCSSSKADNAHDALNEKFGLPTTQNNPFTKKH